MPQTDSVAIIDEKTTERYPIYALGKAWFATLPANERTAIEAGLAAFMSIVASPTEAMQAEDVRIYLEAHREFRLFKAAQVSA